MPDRLTEGHTHLKTLCPLYRRQGIKNRLCFAKCLNAWHKKDLERLQKQELKIDRKLVYCNVHDLRLFQHVSFFFVK